MEHPPASKHMPRSAPHQTLQGPSPSTPGSDHKSSRTSHEHRERHHHHHHHRPHHHHRHHREKSTTQIAVKPPAPRIEPSPSPPRSRSRRESSTIGGGDDGHVELSSGSMALSKHVKQVFTEADLKQAKDLDRRRNE